MWAVGGSNSGTALYEFGPRTNPKRAMPIVPASNLGEIDGRVASWVSAAPYS
jgi:hypothetical protein